MDIKNVKLVIFDMDGLMLDTEQCYYYGVKEMCEKKKIKVDMSVYRAVIGTSGAIDMKKFNKSNYPDDVVEKMVEAFPPEADAVYGDVHFIRDKRPNVVVRYYSSRLFRRFMLRFGFMPAHPSLYVRREVFKRVGLYKTDYRIGSDFEMVVRMFHTFGIKTQYIPLDFVTMRMGGTSTRNIASRAILLKEDTRACRENGILTNKCVMSCKYIFKLMEYRPGVFLR